MGHRLAWRLRRWGSPLTVAYCGQQSLLEVATASRKACAVNPSDTEQVVDGKDLRRGDPDLHTPAGSRHERGPLAPRLPATDDPLPVDPDAPAAGARDASVAARARGGLAWRILAAIFVGGFAGGLARYALGLAFPAPRGAFPTATFAINIAGSFALALLAVYVTEIWPPTRYVRPLLGVGFCGAFTTFSTWIVGVDQLYAAGHAAAAAGYLFGSLVAGVAATSLGLTVGRAVVVHHRHVQERGRHEGNGS